MSQTRLILFGLVVFDFVELLRVSKSLLVARIPLEVVYEPLVLGHFAAVVELLFEGHAARVDCERVYVGGSGALVFKVEFEALVAGRVRVDV